MLDSPGQPGTKVEGQIETPMSSKNVDRQNTPGMHSYKNTMNLNSPGGSGQMGAGSEIEGPGKKGSWKK